mgnify:CR=1 FL=1
MDALFGTPYVIELLTPKQSDEDFEARLEVFAERYQRILDEGGAPDSTLEATWEKFDEADVSAGDIETSLSAALVAPVLTAHPTETRRRTVFDAQKHITDLMLARHAIQDAEETARTEARLADVERNIRRRMTILWQTALIRQARPRIEDEIEVGLRYYTLSLLKEIPALNRHVHDSLTDRFGADRERREPAGDRQGVGVPVGVEQDREGQCRLKGTIAQLARQADGEQSKETRGMHQRPQGLHTVEFTARHGPDIGGRRLRVS